MRCSASVSAPVLIWKILVPAVILALLAVVTLYLFPGLFSRSDPELERREIASRLQQAADLIASGQTSEARGILEATSELYYDLSRPVWEEYFVYQVRAAASDDLTHYGSGRPGVIRLLREARTIIPDSTVILNFLGSELMAALEFEEAAGFLKQSCALDSTDNYTGLMGLAECLIHQGNYADATHYLEQAHKIQPDSLMANYYLGYSLIQLQNWSRATEYLKFAHRHGSDWIHDSAGIYLALALARGGSSGSGSRDSEATAAQAQAAEILKNLSPSSSRALLDRAVINFYHLRNYSEALKDLIRVEKEFGADFRFRYMLAISYLNNQLYQPAYQILSAINPAETALLTDAEAVFLSRILVEEYSDLDSALSLLHNFNIHYPTQFDVALRRADLLLDAGRTDEAAEVFQQLIELGAGSRAWLGLVQAEISRQNLELAENLLADGLKLHPEQFDWFNYYQALIRYERQDYHSASLFLEKIRQPDEELKIASINLRQLVRSRI